MISAAVRTSVIARASQRCEYCRRHQQDSPLIRLQIEHVIPRKHGGTDDLENLAAACIDCNLRKGPNLAGIDPVTGAIVALFDPRRQAWAEHLAWDGLNLVGLTEIGRTTIRVLDLNSDDRVEVRFWAVQPEN